MCIKYNYARVQLKYSSRRPKIYRGDTIDHGTLQFHKNITVTGIISWATNYMLCFADVNLSRLPATQDDNSLNPELAAVSRFRKWVAEKYRHVSSAHNTISGV